MNNYIERYVNDVIRRLPEKDRDEVRKELKSNIYDMLSDDTDDNEIKSVLYKMGPPASLAEKYRTNPRYLISPAIFDDYIRALKWILPLVGSLALIIGMILGAIDAIKDEMIEMSKFINIIISQGISTGVSVACQALVWTTIGFLIAEQTGVRVNEKKEKLWQVDDLPDLSQELKSRIPLSDCIVELAIIVFLSILAVLYCKEKLPFALTIKKGDIQIYNIFNSSFLASCIPVIIIIALFSIVECVAKIIKRRFTPLVCGTVLVSSLINMSLILYLLYRSDIFSMEFRNYLQGVEWGSYDVMRFLSQGGSNPIIILFTIIIVVSTLAECGNAVYKTFRKR